jgi:hypothetical protein
MPKIRGFKELEDAPVGELLYRHDGYNHRDGEVPLCHWCRGVRSRECRWVRWHSEGRLYTSKLCADCAPLVTVCMNCAASDTDAEDHVICCLQPPGRDGADIPVGDHGWCLLGYKQRRVFSKEELIRMLKVKDEARLG